MFFFSERISLEKAFYSACYHVLTQQYRSKNEGHTKKSIFFYNNIQEINVLSGKQQERPRQNKSGRERAAPLWSMLGNEAEADKAQQQVQSRYFSRESVCMCASWFQCCTQWLFLN